MKTKSIRLLPLLLLLVISGAAIANPVDLRTAREVAMKFMNANAKVPLRSAEDLQLVTTFSISRGDAAFHVFNTPNGFVIVAADDCAHPILGYADEGRPFDAENVPIQLQDILQGYVEQIGYGIEHHLAADEKIEEQWRQVRATGRLSNSRDYEQVGPLLTTTWDQGQYYNAMCPEDANGPDGHVYTGCVATAMAQIIKYWGHPVSGRGIHSYDSNYGTLTVNYEESYYDFDNMPDALNTESTTEQVEAVAKLMYDCGVAVNMGYSAYESGSLDPDARAALINFFKFSSNLSFAEKSKFDIDEWNAMMQTDLNANHLIYYCGNGTGGHAFVCDGYNTNGYFHFNFGWSGTGNSWYLLDAVNPPGMNYSFNQAAILGIIPDNSSNVILGQTQGNSTFTVDEPLEFYHLMGHNLYEGNNYYNSCNNTVNFVPADETSQMVVDIMQFDNQNLTINDGDGTMIRSLNGGGNNDLSPIVSSNHAISILYSGNLTYSGFKLSISQDSDCRMVSNIISSVEATTVHLSWVENGEALQWEIEYGVEGFVLGCGSSIIVDNTNVDMTGLRKFVTYDFYIRPICGDMWFGPITIMTEALYWTDVVTSQPEGYQVDVEGNIQISTAEGLAWFSKLSQADNFDGRHVTLMNDINLGQYKWKPIASSWNTVFSGVFDGQGYQIDSMYTIEREANGATALFSDIKSATIKNVCLTNCFSKQMDQSAAGVVVSVMLDKVETNHDTIMNCFVRGRIEGNYYTAPIVSFPRGCFIINCASNCEVIGGGSYSSGIACESGVNDEVRGVLRNCYSASRISSTASWQAYVLGFGEHVTVENCYGYFPRNGYMPIVNGSQSTFRDNAWFDESDGDYYLFDSIFFEPDNQYYSNLTEALNAGVRKYNLPGLRIWVNDTTGINEGMPVLGPEFVVNCPNVRDLTAKNITGTNGVYGVELSWVETGDAATWEIKYHIQDSADEVRILTTSNLDTIWGLTEQSTYVFSVRPICGSTDIGGWSEELEHVFDRPYWTDIVTSQPDGYIVDLDGNVTISSPEGLAWFVSVVNGLNGELGETFWGKLVALTQNIDIGAYKWTPINGFLGVFDGRENAVTGLYINELSDNQGLFGKVFGGSYYNIYLNDAYVKGLDYVGMLIGVADNSIVTNCHVQGTSNGNNRVGGLIGQGNNCELINKCSSSGTVHANNNDAGGLIGIANTSMHNTSFIIRNSYSRCDISSNFGSGGLVGTNHARIENCYAVGNVNSSLYNGGLISRLCFAEIENCYFGGNVSKTSFMYVNGYPEGYLFGAITGETLGSCVISNCYGLNDEVQPFVLVGGADPNYNGNPVMSNTVPYEVLDGSFVLLDSVAIGQAYYINMLEALNTWVDINNDEGLYCHWIMDTEMINGGFPILEDMETYSITITATVNPSVAGSVNGSGIHYYGETAVVTAIANEGYVFVNWTENGSVVSESASYIFMVNTDRELVANFGENGGAGLLNGVFSVSGNTQVCFSQGNLRYQASTDTWRFAENQWDYVGLNNINTSPNYGGWMDLFGWGTSGYDHGAVSWQPWSTSLVNSEYYAYGSDIYNLNDQTGQADWGYNTIGNGGNCENFGWRTLTRWEWQYVFDRRNTNSGIRYAKATVNGINGVVLLPDDWDASYYPLDSVNQNNASYNSNTITDLTWEMMERFGAVFLPSAGYRSGTEVREAGALSSYWSSSCDYGGSSALCLSFDNSSLVPGVFTSRSRGAAVRLACSVCNITTTANPVIGGLVGGSGLIAKGQTCTLIAAPNPGYVFVNWTKNGVEVSIDPVYSFMVTNSGDYVANFVENPNVVTQNTALDSGWTWYAPTVETSIEAIKLILGSNMLLIQAKDSTPSGNIVPGQMYKIQTSAPCALTVTGLPIITAVVNIVPGDNWLAYISRKKVVAKAFANFTPAEGDKVISQEEGFAVFENGEWHGTLETMQPGKGYVYVSNAAEPKTLVIRK